MTSLFDSYSCFIGFPAVYEVRRHGGHGGHGVSVSRCLGQTQNMDSNMVNGNPVNVILNSGMETVVSWPGLASPDLAALADVAPVYPGWWYRYAMVYLPVLAMPPCTYPTWPCLPVPGHVSLYLAQCPCTWLSVPGPGSVSLVLAQCPWLWLSVPGSGSVSLALVSEA